MERISQHNYEAFFLDYMEGNLDVKQEFELLDFLERHPELKVDLEEDFKDVKLSPVASTSLNKEFLKKEGIQVEDVDDLMIASIESQLALEDEVELQNYIEENNLQESFKYYQHSILEANLAESYGNTADLKKRDRMLSPIFYSVAAAALVVSVLLGLYVNNSAPRDSFKEVLTEPVQLVEKKDDRLNGELEGVFTDQEDNGIPQSEKDQNQLIHQSVNEFEITDGNDTSDELIGDYVNPMDIEEHAESDQIGSSVNSIDKLDSTNYNDSNLKEPEENEKINEPQEEIKSKKDRDKEKKNDIVTDEPIKIITDIAGNIFKRDIYYKRSTRTSTGQKVERHIKLGKFTFDQNKH
jgi:hypothetical protein